MKARNKLRRPSCSRVALKKVRLSGWTIDTGTHALEFRPTTHAQGLLTHRPLTASGEARLLGEVQVGYAPSSTLCSEKTGKPAPRVSVCVTLYLDPPVFFDLDVAPEQADDAARRMTLGAVFDLHAAPKVWPEEAKAQDEVSPRATSPSVYLYSDGGAGRAGGEG